MYLILVEKEFNHPLIGIAFTEKEAFEIVKRKRQGGGTIRLVEVAHEDVLVPWGQVGPDVDSPECRNDSPGMASNDDPQTKIL